MTERDVFAVSVCDRDGRVIDRAEADDSFAIVEAARVLWDESLTGLVGERRRARFYRDSLFLHETDRRP